MKASIIVLSLCLLVLIGCGGAIIDGPHQGKKGLVVEFSPYTQREAYEESGLTIGIQATNMGAENIEGGILVVSAPPLHFEDFESTYEINLVGKKETHQAKGDEFLQTLNLKTKPIFASEKKETEIIVSACYPYTTVFSTPVCVDTDYLNQNPNKPQECPPRTTSYSLGQGAPINVIKVTPQMIPQSGGEFIVPTFKIEIAKTSEGKVFEKNDLAQACTPKGPSLEGLNKIDTSNIFLGSEHLSCDKAQIVVNQEEDDWYEYATITCSGEQIHVSQQPYIGSLTITLTYGFQTTLHLPVTIKRS